MKIQTKCAGTIFKVILSLVVAAPFFSSCANLDEVWEKFDEVDARLDSLESSLNNQIQAMSGQATIADCKRNDNGSIEITLSSGLKFTVLPEGANSKPLLTYIEDKGVKYWAIYDKNGDAVALKNSDGEMIPVESELPVVEKVNGEYVLTIGGETYVTGQSTDDMVTIFTAYELHKDDSGNVYSVSFTFGENMVFTIPVDGYKGFSFHMVGDINSTVIKNYYIAYGETARLRAGMEGVVDYVMQIPDGWRVKEIVIEGDSETYFDITAPTEATVEAGAAVSGGDLKVVAVVEGGKSMVARLELSTVPFKRIANTATNAIIEKYNGVDKILYGICRYDEYNPEQILDGADALLQANDKGVTDKDVNVSLAEMLGEELDVEERYVIWAIPAFYYSEGDNAGFYLKEGLIFSHEFGAVSVNLSVDKVTFDDASISLKLAGFASYYGGTAAKTEEVFDDILYQVNNDMLDSYTEPMVYEGSAFAFPTALSNSGVEVSSGASYVTWVIPVTEGKTAYSEEDIVYKEFVLSDIEAGGSISVTSSDPTITRTGITVPLAAVNAARIYYVWLDQSGYRVVKDNEDKKVEELLENGTIVSGSSVDAVIDKIRPSQKRYLLAMAVDSDGKYGEVLDVNYTTLSMSYNSISVTVEVVEVSQTEATLSVTASGGTPEGYVYWVGRDTDPFWLAQDKLKTNAEEYIACFPEDQDVVRAMGMYSLTDGVLSLDGLKGDANYIVLVLAKDADGNYSHAGYKKFTTLAVDLGTIVREGSTEWEAAKSQINIDWNENRFRLPSSSMGYAVYAFDITIPTNFTAYIWCIADSYFEENSDIRSVEDKIVDIEAYCSRKYDADKVVYGPDGGYASEPDWVDDSGTTHKGTLMNVYDFYVHGYPTNGFATYFAAGSHGADCCTAWKDGECSNLAHAQNSIEKRRSLEFYKQYVSNTRGSYLTQESKLNKVAEDLYNAYLPYYQDAEPKLYINNGEALHMEQHNGAGPDDNGNVMDDVYVVLIDADGNYYEPIKFDVPGEYFQ